MMLYPPQGAELFRCPCGQVLRNPYYQRPPEISQANQTKYMTEAELKRQRRNQNMTDAGIGIG